MGAYSCLTWKAAQQDSLDQNLKPIFSVNSLLLTSSNEKFKSHPPPPPPYAVQTSNSSLLG